MILRYSNRVLSLLLPYPRSVFFLSLSLLYGLRVSVRLLCYFTIPLYSCYV